MYLGDLLVLLRFTNCSECFLTYLESVEILSALLLAALLSHLLPQLPAV